MVVSLGGFLDLNPKWFFEFFPMIFCPFDDVAHVNFPGGQSEQNEGEESGEGMGHALFGAGIGNGLDGSGKGAERKSGHDKPPWEQGR